MIQKTWRSSEEVAKLQSSKSFISLGRNCEVSWMIQEYMGNLESSLFSWVAVIDEDLFLEVLENIDDIFKEEIHYHGKSPDMFIDDKYKLAFHGRTPRLEMFNEEMRIKDIALYNKTIIELKERVKYLKGKFIKQVEDADKYIFVKTYEITEDNRSNILMCLRKLGKWGGMNGCLIVVVIENRWYDMDFFNIEGIFANILFIRTVKYLAPYDKTRNADRGSWMRIFREFGGKRNYEKFYGYE